MTDPILEAAAQALADGRYLGCLCCYRDSDPHPVWAEDREHLGPRPVWQEDRETAAAVLAVARPLIETETRERIARAIDDDRDQVTARLRTETEIDIADQLTGERIGLNRAARIARGDTTGHEQEPAK
jgi:hypothetical protein